jgi:hypothetical protein
MICENKSQSADCIRTRAPGGCPTEPPAALTATNSSTDATKFGTTANNQGCQLQSRTSARQYSERATSSHAQQQQQQKQQGKLPTGLLAT